MELGDLLTPQAVAAEAGTAGQKPVFERLGQLLAEACGADPAVISAALAERERLGTTGFGNGTAVPHGRVPGLERQHAALLRLAQPVEWNAVDGMPVDLFLALVGPDEPDPSHLKALALLSRTLRDRPLVEKMRGAADAGALWALLAQPHREAA